MNLQLLQKHSSIQLEKDHKHMTKIIVSGKYFVIISAGMVIAFCQGVLGIPGLVTICLSIDHWAISCSSCVCVF